MKGRLFTVPLTACSATCIAKAPTASQNGCCFFVPYITNHEKQQKLRENFNLPLTFNLKCILNISTRNESSTLSKTIKSLSGCLKMWNKKIYFL